MQLLPGICDQPRTRRSPSFIGAGAKFYSMRARQLCNHCGGQVERTYFELEIHNLIVAFRLVHFLLVIAAQCIAKPLLNSKRSRLPFLVDGNEPDLYILRLFSFYPNDPVHGFLTGLLRRQTLAHQLDYSMGAANTDHILSLTCGRRRSDLVV